MVNQSFIPVYQPDLSGAEGQYLMQCIDTGWISSSGKFIDSFESSFAEFTGVDKAITVANGTVALHLALVGLGIGPGDEVLVPTFTYIASVNAIKMCGATPVFVEAKSDDWLLDVEDAEGRITEKTKAIMAVHLYSGLCDMPAICVMAKRHDLLVIEDAAEAFGCRLGDKHAGLFGDVATFSFFGNKTVTTGEGGMVICRDGQLDHEIRRLKSQGVSTNTDRLEMRYWHDLFAYNYRMNNPTAAIGLAQMERAENTIAKKQELASKYRDALADLPVEFQQSSEDVKSAHWLNTFLLPFEMDREKLMRQLQDDYKIQTRPTFFCAHHMPVFEDKTKSFPVSENIAGRGISIPSYPSMSGEDIDRVIDALKACING